MLRGMNRAATQLKLLKDEVVACRACARLVAHCEEVARRKRRAFRDWDYWGRPVPGFGDAQARLFILGLAPAAHGANRTGRVFTGDRSGEFLFAALHRAGFANQAHSTHRGDGLKLRDAYIAAACRCAPPANKPLPQEMQNCRRFLAEEMRILRPRAVLALGKIALDAYVAFLREPGMLPQPQGETVRRMKFRFAHGEDFVLPAPLPRIFCVYHPSQQNTQTGLLKPAMYDSVLRRISRFLAE